MRLTPAQIAVRLICGQAPGPLQERYSTLADQLVAGRKALVELTGLDFGYDLSAWHEHLRASREGGYTWGRNIALPRVMKEAMSHDPWQAAVAVLEPKPGKGEASGE